MKILPNGIKNSDGYQVSKLAQKEKEMKTAGDATMKAAGKTDTLTIKSVPEEIKVDAQFVENLKNQILSEVKAGADLHKMDDLKKQISLGQYDINPADIVRKMMKE